MQTVMNIPMDLLLALAILAPLVACLIAGLFGRFLKEWAVNFIALPLIGLAFLVSVYLFYSFCTQNQPAIVLQIYDFEVIDSLNFNIGFLIDRLTVMMMVVVTFVSLLVHVYSIGYMKGDLGYARFFSYISGFTFSMLALVMANNFLLLFFGWEAVGVFSYLLIGFWFHRDRANVASFRAFIANRVGDMGFLLGIGLVLSYSGSLDYQAVFALMPALAQAHPGVITIAALLLFCGAIGKSAQIPLHVWLEGSMEGPTPISALIHAATMVTAGVFMVARLSPIFEYSDIALSIVLMVGALTCFFMAVLGLVQHDIKRVIAYSTLSQLGYMMAAQGASAYAVGIFHLMTHASFKALLFLAAGSVIIALHHEQDIRKMGGLARKMPITYVCMLMGALALCGLPPFSGFFSKDLIIEAVGQATIAGHAFAFSLILGATIVTSLYTFRLFFLVFHGHPRMTLEEYAHVKESPWTITLPLILLAIPSLFAGLFFFRADLNGFFGSSLLVLITHPAMQCLSGLYQNAGDFMFHNVFSWPCLLALVGVMLAYLLYVKMPSLPREISKRLSLVNALLMNRYYIDTIYNCVFIGGTRLLGLILYRVGDVLIIDRMLAGGLVKACDGLGSLFRKWQTGRLAQYAFSMVIAVLAFFLLIWLNQ